MPPQHFVIVGAGVGGLATALRLSHLGHRVTVLEKTHQIGGRNRPLQVGLSEFDSGPTLMMMLDPFFQLFRDVGEKLEDHLDIELCDPSYRVFYADGSTLDGSPNVAKMVRQIETMMGPKDAAAYPRMVGDLGSLYHDAVPNFVRKNFYTPLSFFSPKNLALVVKHKMLANLGHRIDHYMDHPKLRMLFTFQTMYLGLSPYDAPWVYSVLTYMEYGEGIWYPKGGMVRIAESIADLARERGAEFRMESTVESVQPDGVTLASGERILADAVIANADLPYVERELLRKPPKKAAKRRYSCSAFMMYLDYEGDIPEMEHHNVLFGNAFKENLDQIFHQRALPDDPAFYVCISSKSDAARSAPGHSNVMVLVPCANLDRPFSDDDAAFLRSHVFNRLEAQTSFRRDQVRAESMLTPWDWRDQLNLDRGAAFGLSHDFWQSALFRPANKSTSHPNVYYVGASTTPGNGLPMVLISAELVEDRLRHDGLI
jgi:phytoene desaturase